MGLAVGEGAVQVCRMQKRRLRPTTVLGSSHLHTLGSSQWESDWRVREGNLPKKRWSYDPTVAFRSRSEPEFACRGLREIIPGQVNSSVVIFCRLLRSLETEGTNERMEMPVGANPLRIRLFDCFDYNARSPYGKGPSLDFR